MDSKQYEIIDTHAHIFPESIATKAVKNIGNFYKIFGDCSAGTAQNLVDEGSKHGVSHYVVHSTATTPRQVRSINNFISSMTEIHSEFTGLMTLHPDQTSEEIRSEIAYALAKGLKGVKLHPDFQEFQINEERAEKIYRETEGVLPILFHTGDSRYDFSTPTRLADVARRHPKQICIAAHFGGYDEWEKIGCYAGLDNIYFDTCSSLFFLSPEQARNIISSFGAEKFMFATDYPMWKYETEIERFLKIPLTEHERKLIFSENAKKMYGI